MNYRKLATKAIRFTGYAVVIVSLWVGVSLYSRLNGDEGQKPYGEYE